MNARASAYVQAIRGPVLLVTIGVLFAIHQAGVLSFSRTWPLLIIVLGVMKLLERTTGPAEAWHGPQHPGYQTPGAVPYPPSAGTGQSFSGSKFPPQGPGGSNP